MDWGSARVKCETRQVVVAGQAGCVCFFFFFFFCFLFFWGGGIPVFYPPNNMALFKINEIILKGRNPNHGLKWFI